MSKHKRLLVRFFVSATAFFAVAAVVLGIYFCSAVRRIYNDEVYSSLENSLSNADEYISSVAKDISDAVDSFVYSGAYVQAFKQSRDYERYAQAQKLIAAINSITARYSNIVGLKLIIPCSDEMKVISAGDYSTVALEKYMSEENWPEDYGLTIIPSTTTGNILAIKRPRMSTDMLVAVEIMPIFFTSAAENGNIVIADTEGRVMYSQHMINSEEDEKILHEIAAEGKSSGIYDALSGTAVVYSKSVFDGLYIFNIQRVKNLDDNLRGIIATLLLIIAVTLLFSVAVAWMLAELLTKRITDFSKGIKNTNFENSINYKTKKTLLSGFKVKNQVIIYHALACGVPLFLAAAVLLTSTTGVVRDSEKRVFEKNAQQVRESFNIWQDRFARMAKIAALEPEVIEVIENPTASYNAGIYENMSIYDRNGELIFSPDAIVESHSINPKEGMYTDRENVYYTARVTRFNVGERDYTDSIIGYVGVNTDKKSFRERAGIETDGGENVYVLDENDKIILSDIVHSEGQTQDTIVIGRGHSLVMPVNGGKIVVVADVKNNESYRLMFETLLLVLLLMGLLAIYTAVMSGHFCSPIQKMKALVKEAADGEFVTISVKTGDEIEELAESFNNMLLEIQGLIKERCDLWEQQRELDYQNKEAQLNILQSQINPHFIYNTLESIKWLVLSGDNEKAADMITRLAGLFRQILKKGDNEIPLTEELEAVRAYIGIQLIRFEDSLTVEENIDVDLSKYKIMRMSLQPLIENAVSHGVEPSEECGRIVLEIKEEGNNLVIRVKDNGIGMSKERLMTVREALKGNADARMNVGIGMVNVNRRIQLLYGEDYGISVDSTENEGTSITLTVPSGRVQNGL